MTRPDLSPAILALLRKRKGTRERSDNLHQVLQRSCETEATLKWRFEEEYAKAFMAASGPVKEREQAATLATSRTRKELYEAIGVRRYAKAAIDSLDKDAELLTAALHAHNREMKVLGG